MNSTHFGDEYFSKEVAMLWKSQRMQSLEWKICLFVAIIVTLLSLYLLLALLSYEILKWRKRLSGKLGIRKPMYISSQYKSNSVNNSAKISNVSNPYSSTHQKIYPGQTIRRTRRIHEDKYDSWMRILSISAALFAFLKCLTEYLDLFFGTFNIDICMTFAASTIMCNGGSLLSVYILMWLRQRAVQSSQALNHLPLKKLKIISWISLITMLVTFVILCLFNFRTIRMRPSVRGCRFADDGMVSQGARSASGIVFTIIFQPSMLGLLLYPLLKHTLNTRKVLDTVATEKHDTMRQARELREEKIKKLIKRLCIAILLCTLSDAGGVVASYMFERHPAVYISLVYDYNVTFGAYVIVCSFTNWRERILPFTKQTKPKSMIYSTHMSRSLTSSMSNKAQIHV